MAPDPVALQRLQTIARGQPQILNRQRAVQRVQLRRITGHNGFGNRRAAFVSRP